VRRLKGGREWRVKKKKNIGSGGGNRGKGSKKGREKNQVLRKPSETRARKKKNKKKPEGRRGGEG